MEVLWGPDPVIWLQEALGAGWAGVAHAVGLLGTTWGIVFLIGPATWLWGRRAAGAIVTVGLVSQALRVVIAVVTSVPRPSAPAIVKYERIGAAPAFPSGHVSLATALWAWPALRRPSALWFGALLVVGLVVGTARLYLGVHQLADVLGGWVLGVLAAAGHAAVWPRVAAWIARRRFVSLAIAAGLLALVAALYLALLAPRNPFHWRVAALAAGLGVALPLEWRHVRLAAAPGRWGPKLLVGLPVVFGLAAIDLHLGEDAVEAAAALVFGGTLWMLLVAPALLLSFGLAQREPPRPAAVGVPVEQAA